MKILLPPSEGKSAPSGGAPVDLESLVFHESLGPSRAGLIDALTRLAGLPEAEAVEALGISPSQAGEVARDAVIESAPAAPAAEVYSGVLYDHLGFGSLGQRASGVAADRVLIASALWGLLRPGDRIPYYRLSMKARLPGLSGLAKYWRAPIAAAMEGSGLDREGELVLDMRSAAYSAAWKPEHARLLAVRAYTEQGGKRKAVTHMAKAVRGEVTRLVVSARRPPDDAESVAALVEGSGMHVELSDRFLDVIEDG